MRRDYKLYLDDILESIEKIERYTDGLYIDEFEKDDKTVDAVVKNLENIGEAAKNIPLSIQKKSSDIPWKEMAGMRDKLVHAYFGIRFDVVWSTIMDRLPQVKNSVQMLLKQLDKDL
jgi:uncharacterized protein with HEPN domain